MVTSLARVSISEALTESGSEVKSMNEMVSKNPHQASRNYFFGVDGTVTVENWWVSTQVPTK